GSRSGGRGDALDRTQVCHPDALRHHPSVKGDSGGISARARLLQDEGHRPEAGRIHELLKLILLVVAALVIGWLGIRWLEQALVYHPDRNLSMIPNSFGLPFEELRLTAEDGASIHGWFLPAPSSKPGYAILFCHGNAGNISHRLTKSRLLRPLGLAILLFDYRGYGRSEGTPSEEGTYWDAEAAYRYLVDKKGYSPDRIVLYGESLGAAVALELALRRASRALILESPFTSVPDMGQRIFPYLPLRWLLRYRYDNLAKIPGLR